LINKNIAQKDKNATLLKLNAMEAKAKFGEIGKNGALLFNGNWIIIDNIFKDETANNESENTKTISVSWDEAKKISEKNQLEKNRLYIINGKEYMQNEIPEGTTITLDGKITQLDEKDGFKNYGDKGKDGVLVFEGKSSFITDISNHEKIKEEIARSKEEIERAKIEIEKSKPEMERAKIEIEKAKKDIEKARTEIEKSKLELERAKIEMENSKKEMAEAKAKREMTKTHSELELSLIEKEKIAQKKASLNAEKAEIRRKQLEELAAEKKLKIELERSKKDK
jgi:myosin protein heavy chain